jgi:2-dehydropantoate 2-reductase
VTASRAVRLAAEQHNPCEDRDVRFVVYGAGAIGGVLGGRLAEHGSDVVLVARGPHLEAIRSKGLTIESPDATVTVDVEAVGQPADARIGEGDVVVLAMKSQDTVTALEALAACAPADTPVVCAQNGVDNERSALRRFKNVYSMCVMCPASHLDPGVVQASSSPVTGLMDLGRWPAGRDAVADGIAGTLSGATYSSVSRDDIARWKWGKLLMNLGNAVEASFQPDEAARQLAELARREGQQCLEAAGIDAVGAEEDAARRGALLTARPIGERPRGGGSTWQSLARSAGVVETDYLTGEIVLLGRLFGVATPVNERLQQLANELARSHEPPASRSADAMLEVLAPGRGT